MVKTENFMIMCMLPQLKKKNDLAPNVSSAEAKQPWILQRECKGFPQLPGYSSWNGEEGSGAGDGASRTPDHEPESRAQAGPPRRPAQSGEPLLPCTWLRLNGLTLLPPAASKPCGKDCSRNQRWGDFLMSWIQKKKIKEELA